MLNFLKRKPAPSTINSVAASIRELPTPPAPPSAEVLPCEQVFSVASVVDDIDGAFISAVADELKIQPRYIPWNSLTPSRIGYLNISLPMFDLLDPFFVHGKGGPRETALAQLEDLRRSRPSLVLGSGVLLGVCSDDVTISSSLGRKEMPGTKESVKAWMNSSAQYLFSLYCTLPGYIPTAYREKIIAARDAAKKVGGQCRLIVEANWKLAGTALGKPDKADPIIVIVKDKTIAYVDRFDCTAKEEHLAREHAVKLP